MVVGVGLFSLHFPGSLRSFDLERHVHQLTKFSHLTCAIMSFSLFSLWVGCLSAWFHFPGLIFFLLLLLFKMS